MGAQGSVLQAQDAVLQVEHPAGGIQLSIRYRNAGQVLGFGQKVFLGGAAAAFADELAVFLGLVRVVHAKHVGCSMPPAYHHRGL